MTKEPTTYSSAAPLPPSVDPIPAKMRHQPPKRRLPALIAKASEFHQQVRVYLNLSRLPVKWQLRQPLSRHRKQHQKRQSQNPNLRNENLLPGTRSRVARHERDVQQ